jgi:hypothetical protein
MTPSELSRYNQLQVAGGYLKNPALAQSLMTDYQQRVARQTQDANLQHDQAYTVATADDGNFKALSRVDPIPAAAIAKSLGFDPASGEIPPQADEAAKQYATSKVNYIHPWTGAPDYKDEGGSFRDTRTGKPAIGQTAQTLTAEQKSARQIELAKPVTLGAGLPTPLGSTPAIAGGSPAQSQQPTVPAPKRAPAVPPANAPQTQTLSGVDLNSIPKLPSAPPARDQVSLDRAKKVNDANIDVQNKALEPLKDQANQASRNTAVYSQLEQTLANANPREFGPSSASYKAVMGLKTYLSGVPPEGLVNQAEADKYLAQLGVGGSKQLLGADQQLRQQEMLLLMSHANPNIDQPLQVIKNLAAYGKAGNEYDLKAANTGIAAIRNGADPFAVPGAIEAQVHRADYVNGSLKTPQAAKDYLKAHPEAAPHFRQKYGYLP